MQFTVNLQAGQRVRQETAGRFFMIREASAPVDVILWHGSQELERVEDAAAGFKARVQPGEPGFTHVEFRADGACTAKCIISSGEVDFDFFKGASVSATIEGPFPLPVQNDRGGSPAEPLHVAGIAYEGVVATGSANVPAAVITDAGAVVVEANANRRALRIANLAPDPVAIGAPGLTWANRCIVLEQGDMWTETEGAPLAWHAITAAGTEATVTAQEVTV